MTSVPELQAAMRALLKLVEVCEAGKLVHLDADARAALVMLIDSAMQDGVSVDSAELGIMVGFVDG